MSSVARVGALDGLRGVAILLVVAAHARPWNLPYAGEIGVSLFFTLSGFLITSILLSEHRRTGSLDLVAFYARRALRLVPGLVVLVAGASLLLWLVSDPRLEDGFGWQALAAVTYTSNFAQAGGVEWPILGHTWSLAIEEQFYLLWPASLLIALRRARSDRRRLSRLLLGLALAALAWRLAAPLLLGGDVSRIYYAPDTNGYGLLAGAALAALPPDRRRLPAPVGYASLLVVLGLCLTPAFPEGSVLSLYLVAAAALLALPVIAAADNLRLLAQRPLVVCGTLSYSWYLWNSPIINLRPGGEQVGTSLVFQVALVLLSLAAATVSYLCVERPALRLKQRFERGSLELQGPVTPTVARSRMTG